MGVVILAKPKRIDVSGIHNYIGERVITLQFVAPDGAIQVTCALDQIRHLARDIEIRVTAWDKADPEERERDIWRHVYPGRSDAEIEALLAG